MKLTTIDRIGRRLRGLLRSDAGHSPSSVIPVAGATAGSGGVGNDDPVPAQDEERRLQEIRSEIVSLVSHDLRAPLSVVIGYLDLMGKQLTDEERAKALEAARRNAGRMSDLLEDLLLATTAEEMLAPGTPAPVGLAELAEEVVSSMAPMHPERELTVETVSRPMVRGEEKRLRQALVNLVTNAFKYAPADSPVTVRVAHDGDLARLQVVDHGPGVPPEERERIFDRYARLESSSGRPGVGLGLYIVRIIAENHDGKARVEDTDGGGATFVIELPCDGETSEGPGAPAEALATETAG